MQISEIEQRTISGIGDNSYKSAIRNLCAPFGLSSLVVHEETLQPGANGSKPHFHTSKEELIVVLQGEIRATCGENVELLSSGSVYGFPCGPDNTHYVTNVGDVEARYLSIGVMEPEDQVVYEKG